MSAYILDPKKKSLAECLYVVGNTLYYNVNVPLPANSFLDLTDTKTSYTMQVSDYMVQISSSTYLNIYLPQSLSLGAKEFIISNNSSQVVTIHAFAGDSIDGVANIQLKPQQHIELTSNSYNKWYAD